MAWRWAGPRWVRRNVDVVMASTHVESIELTAAAQVVNQQALRESRRHLIPQYASWQKELWDRYDECGEFGIAVNWRASMMSRIRLHAARVKPGSDEPVIVDSGVASDLVNRLFDDVGGQSEAVATISTYLDVPGEGWVVGEKIIGKEKWRTYSSDEIRGRGSGFEVIDERSLPGSIIWRDLAADALIVRVWRPHRRLHHEPYSPARAALSAIRELDLVNRHIQAQYLSRLASAGIIILPDELTFPTRPEFNDAPDPFIAEWIETAREAIATPGTAAAVVPIPMRLPAEYVDKVHHIDFTLRFDEKIIEKREAARRRLAGIINVPTDLLFDSGSINHWGLWQLEESGVKTYITPDFELIVNALTVGYLRPRLRTLGEDFENWVVWYDASEIVSRPNIADNVVKTYDRLEASGKALRREVGLDEDDKPTNAELADIVLKKLAVNPQVGLYVLEELTGRSINVTTESDAITGQVGRPTVVPPNQRELQPKSRASGPPSTDGEPRREPRGAAGAERVAFAVLQANSQHVIRFDAQGYVLKHPLLCQPHLFSCPFTHATYDGVPIRPGTSGDYECTLTSAGDLVIGRRVFPSDDAFIIDAPRRTNGVVVLT